jgi:hypothetical protein
MDFEQAKLDIEQWIRAFVEKPNPALNNWAPCPYARQARLASTIAIVPGNDPYFDLVNLAKDGLGGKSVVIFVYNPVEWSYEQFSRSLHMANKNYLLPQDILALEDHPADPEIVNGVSMNQGTYAMAMCQSVTDLNTRAKHMAAKGFYNSWPEDYLQALFQHRQDPRS